MGQGLVIVSSPLVGCVSITPFRLRSVASALSLSESWLFLLLWICWCITVGTSSVVPRGNFWGSHEGWVFQFSPWIEFWLTSSLSFPGCSHSGFVVASSPGFRLRRSGRLVASGSSELGAAQSVHSVLSLHHILAFVRCELESPLVPSLTAARLGLWPSGLAVASLPLVSRPWTGLCWSHLMSLSSLSDRFVVLPRQLVGSGVCSPASTICPSVVKRSSFGLSASVSLKSSRWGHPSGSSLSQSSIGTKTLPPPSWCLVGVFMMRSPCRVEFVSDLDRNEDSSRTFPSGWCRAFAMGSPVSGRVAHFCALDQNEVFFRSSILCCFAMGSPCGSSVFFSHSIVTKSALDIWSVFLQDGVTSVGSGSDDLISNEGITTVGALGSVFSGPSLGCLCVILWSAGLLWSGVGSTFCCLRFWRGLCVYPSSQRRSGSWPFFFWPCCLSPSPGDWSASAASRWFFSPGRFMRWSSTHEGLLAAFPEVGLLGMGCWCMLRGLRFSASLLSRAWGRGFCFWRSGRTLLQATSLPLGMDVSPAPGQSLSVSTFYGLQLCP